MRYRVPEYPFRVSSTDAIAGRLAIQFRQERETTLYVDLWNGKRWERVRKEALARGDGTQTLVVRSRMRCSPERCTRSFKSTPASPSGRAAIRKRVRVDSCASART